ncbi:serine protease [Nonomuraea sp. NPDC005983]|uniref:S1 family peptidase n=1 Tax=Nonomuraea sp. NPDC005983 TaxID=3155595 RepID=UPI0033A01737
MRSAVLATLMAAGLALTTASTAAAATVLQTSPAGAASVGRPAIIGGKAATEPYSFMVSFRLNTLREHHCGGALIAPDWVVTAAHCEGLMKPGKTQVRIGSPDRDNGGALTSVKRIITHPGWTDPSGEPEGDIALVQLDRPVDLQPIRIADSPGRVGEPTRIIGWGMTCEYQKDCAYGPKQLQELETVRVPDRRCVSLDRGTEVCTGALGKKAANACNGDSGGPQIRKVNGRWELIGATSRDGDDVEERQDGGAGCATNPDGRPGLGIWTDVTHYRSWIADTIGKDAPADLRNAA